MSRLKIRQSSKLRGKDWWEWSVWLEGSDSELEGIKEVRYLLHPTFPNPAPVIRDRATGFLLRSAGWGEFKIVVEIHRRNGRIERRAHQLKLENRMEGDGGESRPLKVFISFSLADSKLANNLRSSLESRNIAVTSAFDMPAGGDWESLLKTAIGESDALIAILSDATNSSVEWERNYAANSHVWTFSVLVGAQAAESRGLEREVIVHLPDGMAVESVVSQIEERIGKILPKDAAKRPSAKPRPKTPGSSSKPR